MRRKAKPDYGAVLMVRVDRDLKRWLGHRAVDEGRPVSEIVREAIVAYKAKAKGGRP